jgi:hypothetical protein
MVIVAPAKPSPRQAADAKHSTAAGGQGYEVLVRGEYHARLDEKRKVAKPFELTVKLPALDKALSVLRRKLLPVLLTKKDPQFVAVRTADIVDVKPLSPTTPESQNLQFMSRPKLLQYIAEYSVPLDPRLDEYKDTVALRDAVMDHRANPRGFEEREARRRADRAETAAVLAMNGGA